MIEHIMQHFAHFIAQNKIDFRVIKNVVYEHRLDKRPGVALRYNRRVIDFDEMLLWKNSNNGKSLSFSLHDPTIVKEIEDILLHYYDRPATVQ